VLCLGRLPCGSPAGAFCIKTMEGSTGWGIFAKITAMAREQDILAMEEKFVRNWERGSGGQVRS
jgi:hypothetical protein